MKNRIKSFVKNHDIEIATTALVGGTVAMALLVFYQTGRTIAAEAALAERSRPIFIWRQSDEDPTYVSETAPDLP